MDADRILQRLNVEITLSRQNGVVIARLREYVCFDGSIDRHWTATKTAFGMTIAEALENLEVA